MISEEYVETECSMTTFFTDRLHLESGLAYLQATLRGLPGLLKCSFFVGFVLKMHCAKQRYTLDLNFLVVTKILKKRLDNISVDWVLT